MNTHVLYQRIGVASFRSLGAVSCYALAVLCVTEAMAHLSYICCIYLLKSH
jgi:hypothetical protein